MEENYENFNIDDNVKSTIDLTHHSENHIFVSNLDRDFEPDMNIQENINEGGNVNNPRFNMSYFSDNFENENYFGKEHNSYIEEEEELNNVEKLFINEQKNNSNFNILTDNTYNSIKNFPSKKELNINSNENTIRISSSSSEINKNKFENKIENEEENYDDNPNNLSLHIIPQNNIQNCFLIIEKCEVKEYIGFHKLYEILYYENNNKKIKCFRRYKNFNKLNSKLLRKYPYLIIPRLTPKNPLVKIITPENDFYENRMRQLNFYLNFLYKNDNLSKSKEFIKFTNEAEFDEGFFNSNEGELNFYEYLKVNENFKNKIFGVFSNFFSSNKDLRKLSDDEILLRKLENHFKGICEKYLDIKNNVTNYIKSLKLNQEGYKNFSDTCFYMKDSLSSIPNAENDFKSHYEICLNLSDINYKQHFMTGIDLENKFEVKIKFFIYFF